MSDERVYLPTEEQEFLLRAALWRGEDARVAWSCWRSAVDLDGEIDGGSLRLLPLAFQNLMDLAIEDPLFGRLKGIYRRSWYRNQLLCRRARETLLALVAGGVEVLLLKGPALILSCYQDVGLRPVDDFGVMVHRRQIAAAIRILKEFGWTAEKPNPRTRLEVRHAVAFGDEKGMRLQLHAHLLSECCNEPTDLPFWENAVVVEFNNVLVLLLAPADQLFHVCVDGMRWSPAPKITWVADAWMIATTCGESIDWDRVLCNARRTRYGLALRTALRYLHERMGLGIPSGVLNSLRDRSITAFERVDFWFRTQPLRQSFWMATLDPILRYVRTAGQTGVFSKIAGFPRFLRAWWELPSAWRIPSAAFAKGLRKLSR